MVLSFQQPGFDINPGDEIKVGLYLIYNLFNMSTIISWV